VPGSPIYVEIFKPDSDNRYHPENIVSHDANFFPSIPVPHARAILEKGVSADVIGIDEAQFFDETLPDVCDKLASGGIRVIVAGLDMDFQAKPFGSMPALLSKAEYITKLHAICVQCGQIANYSYRKSGNAEQLLIGNKDLYEPRCRVCYQKGDLLK